MLSLDFQAQTFMRLKIVLFPDCAVLAPHFVQHSQLLFPSVFSLLLLLSNKQTTWSRVCIYNLLLCTASFDAVCIYAFICFCSCFYWILAAFLGCSESNWLFALAKDFAAVKFPSTLFLAHDCLFNFLSLLLQHTYTHTHTASVPFAQWISFEVMQNGKVRDIEQSELCVRWT